MRKGKSLDTHVVRSEKTLGMLVANTDGCYEFEFADSLTCVPLVTLAVDRADKTNDSFARAPSESPEISRDDCGALSGTSF